MIGRLRGLGYQTGLFAASDLGFESLDAFLFNQNYDKFHHYGSASKKFKAEHYLNSWGGDDHSMVDESIRWVKSLGSGNSGGDNGDGSGGGGDDRPWMMHLLSDSTHHPYSVPKGDPAPFKGGDGRLDAYHNSMRYTDECLGRLVDGLKASGEWENTMFIVTGDHGEAFGAANGDHPRNYLHKNFMYEENVRTHLMIHDPSVASAASAAAAPSKADRPLVSERVASVGDIFPTIVAAVTGSRQSVTHLPGDEGKGGSAVESNRDIPGRSLLSSQWVPRAVFFHKTSAPIQWGLRDGRYKFIANQVGSHAELYDLRTDPKEHNNLIKALPKGFRAPSDAKVGGAVSPAMMVEAYHAMSEAWFMHVHCLFMRRLNGYQHGGGCFDHTKPGTEGAVTMRQAGPKKGAFGYKNEAGEFKETQFVDLRTSSVCLFTEWLPYETSEKVFLDFAPKELHRGLQRVSDPTPSALTAGVTPEQRQVVEWTIEPAWHTTWWYFHMTTPLTVGTWEVIVWSSSTGGEKDTKLLTTVVEVKSAWPAKLPAGLIAFETNDDGTPDANRCALLTKSMRTGYTAKNGTFYPTSTFHPGQRRISMEVKWTACGSKRNIEYRTADPSNEVYTFKQNSKLRPYTPNPTLQAPSPILYITLFPAHTMRCLI